MSNNNKTISKNIFLLIIAIILFINHSLMLPKASIFIGYICIITYIVYLDKKIYLYVYPFLFILFSGFIFAIEHSSRDIIRDIFYFTLPIISILIGSIFANFFSLENFLLQILRLGTFLSIIYILTSIQLFGLELIDNFTLIRVYVGSGNFLTVLSILLILMSSKYRELECVKKYRFKKIFLFINLLAFIFFSSRTYLFVFIILLLFLILPTVKKNIFKYSFISAILIVISISIIYKYKDIGFISKLLYSFDEISINSREVNVNINYRGYETKRVLDTYFSGSFFEYFFGYGFGKLVDLKEYVKLSVDEINLIPIFHNGYSYLLLKTGIVGVFSLFIFIKRIIYLAKSISKYNNYFLTMLCLGTLFSICFATYVVTGFFNPEFISSLIFLGAIIKYMLNIKYKQI